MFTVKQSRGFMLPVNAAVPLATFICQAAISLNAWSPEGLRDGSQLRGNRS
jgi:hypothetical protein